MGSMAVRAVVAFCLLMFLLLTAGPAGAASRVLQLASLYDLPSPDPAKGSDSRSAQVDRILYATLLTYRTGDMALRGELAERWQWASPRRLLFHLRPGLRFADGSPLTAREAVASLQRFLSPRILAPYATSLWGIEGARAFGEGRLRRVPGIRAVDARTLEVRVTRPDPSLPYAFALPFTGVVREEGGGRLVGSGPFVIASWRSGREVRFSPNRFYLRPLGLAGISVRIGVTPANQYRLWQKGQLDLLGAPFGRIPAPVHLAVLRSPWRGSYLSASAPAVYYLGFKMNRSPVASRFLREAIACAIDRRRLVRILGNRPAAADRFLPPGIGPGPGGMVPSRDRIRARRLLRAGGFPAGGRLELTLPTDPDTLRVGQMLVHQLGEVGIALRLRPVAFPTLLALIGRPEGPPFFLTNWTADDPDPAHFLGPLFDSRYRAPRGQNTCQYRDGAVDRDLRLGTAAAARRAEARILGQVAAIPLYYGYNEVLVRKPWPRQRAFYMHPLLGTRCEEIGGMGRGTLPGTAHPRRASHRAGGALHHLPAPLPPPVRSGPHPGGSPRLGGAGGPPAQADGV